MIDDLLFWVIAGGIALLGGAWLARPFLVRPSGDEDPFADTPGLRVHKAALDEVRRDQAAGLISAEDAEAATVEIQRRMLKEADEDTPTGKRHRASPALAALILGGIPVSALALYLVFGNPGVPDQPLAQRGAEREEINLDRARFQEEIDALRSSLESNPDNLETWVRLGAAHREVGDFETADRVFRKALELARLPEILVRLSDVLIAQAEGIVPLEAKTLLREALDLAPGLPQARYFLALGKLQEGDPEGALRDWLALEPEIPADSDWGETLREAIQRAANQAGVDLEDIRAQVQAALPPVRRGPTQEDVAAASDLSDEDRAAFIETMVDRLSERLEEDPTDVDGWLQLARSYQVLGRDAESQTALRRAAEAGPNRPDVLVSLAFSLYSPADLQAGRRLPEEAERAMENALALNPDQVEALLLLGIRDAQNGQPADARQKWSRIIARLDPGNPLHQAVKARIESLPAE